MFAKNDKKSEDEVDQLIERFNLQSLNSKEKETLIGMAKDRTLVSQSSTAITSFAFQKTVIYQNWIIIGQLIELNKKLDR